MTAQRHVHELLPWYVNGSLDEREMDRVTSHLAVCAACAAEVEAAVALGRRVQPGERDERQLAKLLDRQPAAYAALTRRIAASRPDRTGLILVACCALVAVLGALAWLKPGQETTFEAMTTVPPAGRVVVQFAFRPNTTESVARVVVLESGGELLGNPNAQGVYRMVIPAEADVAAQVAELRAHPAVLWADREL